MLNNPIEQRFFEADIGSGFLALDPLVFQNLFALRQELLVKNGVLNELRLIFCRNSIGRSLFIRKETGLVVNLINHRRSTGHTY